MSTLAVSPVEKHFTPAELAEVWGLEEKSIRRIFEKEPGVMVFSRATGKAKRKYTTLRIPESVMVRVHQRMLNG